MPRPILNPQPSRPWKEIDIANTIHFIGDTHFGRLGAVLSTTGIPTGRSDKVKTDIRTGSGMPASITRIQVGDFTEDVETSSDTEAKNWQNGGDGKGTIPGTFRHVIGNHDMMSPTGDPRTRIRTGAEAASAYGYNARNWTLDVGFAKLIGVSPSGSEWIDLDGAVGDTSTAVGFLDAELASATKDCIIVAHAPLENTVLGGTTFEYDSTEPGFNIGVVPGGSDAPIRAILAARSRAKVWISGHTHSNFGVTGWATPHLTNGIGTRSILAVNASAVYYTGRQADLEADPIKSLFLTWKPGGANTITLRVRNHGSHCWDMVNDQAVTTLTIPA